MEMQMVLMKVMNLEQLTEMRLEPPTETHSEQLTDMLKETRLVRLSAGKMEMQTVLMMVMCLEQLTEMRLEYLTETPMGMRLVCLSGGKMEMQKV